MRRLVSLAVLLLFAVPFGLSVNGCKKALAVEYCGSGDSGPSVGQVAVITLSPTLATYGESLNYGQIGQALNASAQDCKGNSVSVSKYVFSSTDGFVAGTAASTFADINPSSGQVCAGTFNRNTGNGIQDYTTCTAPPSPPSNYLAYVTATAEGAVSNAIPVFVHAVPNDIVIGEATPSPCSATSTDPSTNCCPLAFTAPGNPPPFNPNSSCLSQNATAQLTARVYDAANNNITCTVGHVNFAAVGATNVVTIDENGVATANQPGSATITASISNAGSGSTAGFFSTCPPASITLAATGKTTDPITVGLNNEQPFTTIVTDTNGVQITGLSLLYNSTTQQTIPTSSNSVTPIFPGSATITAVCAPGACNPSPYSQIGYQGNGVPLTSNGITVNATGTSSTVLFIGSTSSQYLYPVDFTTNQPATLLKLPYVPNSMVINQGGTEIFLGSTQALMTVSATTNSLTATNTQVTGSVLAVSNGGSELVVTDPVRQTISLISTSGSVAASYGGVATRAAFSPDDNTVYITTTTNQLLVHNAFTSWTALPLTAPYTDVAVTVPHVGAYFSGTSFVEGRTYCPVTTLNTATSPPTTTNSFYPIAQTATGVTSDRIAATTDGLHILTAAAASGKLTDLNLTAPNGLNATVQCPAPGAAAHAFTSAINTQTLTGLAASAITGVIPATNSAAAFVTYTGTSTNAAGQLPVYFPGTAALSQVLLSGGAIAPVAGVFSSDNLTFFAGTSGDNTVHKVAMTYPTGSNPTAVESGIITPALPCGVGNLAAPNLTCAAGSTVTPNLIVQRPKLATN